MELFVFWRIVQHEKKTNIHVAASNHSIEPNSHKDIGEQGVVG